MSSGWSILKKIAEGGAGEVYLARSPDGAKVAVKVFPVIDEKSRAVFEGQVRTLLRLRHPSIVSVEGYLLKSDEIFGEDRGPCYWMEYVEGRELPAAAAAADVPQILRWFHEALEALAFVHSQKAVHGDLSPKNILIDEQGRVRILDFSVLPGARLSDVATLPYMAPERIDGRLSPSGDLFSLGTIFYEAFSGQHPRAGCKTVQELIRFDPRALADVTTRITADAVAAKAIDRMIRAKPSERLADASKILEALDEGRWKETAPAPGDFYPLEMLGAEKAFAAIEEGLESLSDRSKAFGLHGPAGVGKTRLLKEIGFEAAIRGADIRTVENLHRSSAEERAGLLTLLKNLPPKGTLVLLEWNDDSLDDEVRRYVDRLIASGLIQDVSLRNLSRENTHSLLAMFLDASSAEEAADILYPRTGGNPRLLLETLKDLSAEKKIRRRSLLPGWKDLLRDFGSPEEVLKARLGDTSPEKLRTSAYAAAQDLWKEGERAVALEVIDHAVKVIEDRAEVSRLLRMKTNILNEMGRFADANACCDRWFALMASDEPAPLKTVKYWLTTGSNLQNLERDDEAAERLRRCVDEGAAHRDDPQVRGLLARAGSLLGRYALKRGHAEESVRLYEEALDLIEPAGARRAEICRNLAAAFSRLGRWGEARLRLEDAKRLYRAEAHAEGEFSTFLQEGNLALENDDAETAEVAYAQAERIARETSSDLRLALVWNNRGHLERKKRNLAVALDLFRRARDVLVFLGNSGDIAHNLRDLAVAEADVGRLQRADELLSDLRDMRLSSPEASGLAADAEAELRAIREGAGGRWTPRELEEIFKNLPPELQMTFVDRGDFQKKAGASAPDGEKKMTTQMPGKGILASLARLNRELLREKDMNRVLNQLMDAAMDMARAESGFLVLRSDEAGGPLPGYEIAIARKIAKEEIQSAAYAFSFSAVRRAVETGDAVVTDNAVLDPLFKEAKSVHLRQLKSILALPVQDADGVLGVFYLDHRFEEGLFEGEVLETLKAFAEIAALALQKGRMIEALERSNLDLSEKVRTQTREINRSRLALKNEYGDIVGRSPRMVEVLSMVDAITDAKVPVWIFGESGTGKEAIARALHFNSGRAKKPFVSENCSALPESLLESELFGHKKGAFTHATADKKGILQYADGGTIFLDEIADMSLGLQAKMLRFLQEGEIRPIGSPEIVRVDVRVVSASNKDLESLVSEGKFREDLYYRLNGVTVRLPPLRERLEDLPLLADHFLKRIGEREKKDPCRLDPQVLRAFLNYGWPGNIRELQNTLETAVLFAPGGTIALGSLQFKPSLLGRARTAAAPNVPKRAPAEPLDPVLEKTLLAIRDNCYHKGMAAKALGIARRTLYERLRRFGISTDLSAIKARIDECLS